MTKPPRPPALWSYLTEHDFGMDKDALKLSFANHVEYTQGKDEYSVTPLDFMQALSRAARDRLMDRWNKTQRSYYEESSTKRVYYLSLEFLIGRLMKDALLNLGMIDESRKALEELGIDLDHVAEREPDAGLGNGGLGRLAACFLDSMATLGLAATGYGIRYEYGIFRQSISHGAQVESPDHWLRQGNPWEIARVEKLYKVKFHGRVAAHSDPDGRVRFDWVDTSDIVAQAYDIPVPGFRNETVNTLRLWRGRATNEFDFRQFNIGDYVSAVHDKNATENISRVLYPNDNTSQGKELRLKQEYFFVSATLQDAIRRHLRTHPSVLDLHDKAVFQLNDTHPAIAIAEMMRLLLDEHALGWDDAWNVTRHCFAYTNHTVLPEALERWSVGLLEYVLPRPLQIIFEINRRFLDEVRERYPGDEGKVQRLSLVDEQGERKVRMAHLAIVGSFSVNGVSELHSFILRERLFREFNELYPGKFRNETNGVTPRRWMLGCNPALSTLITSSIGDRWLRDLSQLERLVPYVEDADFRAGWRAAKRENKLRLADYIGRHCGTHVDPDSIFDVQVKRLHEYKRQHLNILHVVALYLEYKRRAPSGIPARTFIFGGKAAPGYDMAKRIIRLVHAVGELVNGDPEISRWLRVVFIPNYCVSLAEIIIPAADVSEQISTAGMEASGTGNMKFSMNGALTIGTLDGANIEIMEAVGRENFFVFGLTDEEAVSLRSRGYDPRAIRDADEEVRAVIDMVASGALASGDSSVFAPIVDSLLSADPFLALADFRSYRDCHRALADAYLDREGWTKKSILNVARMGRFSSDATIHGYARDIWGVTARK